jgi:hypothetical protein
MKRTYRQSVARVTSQPVGVPDTVGALNNCMRAAKGIPRAQLTLLRGDRGRSKGNDEGESDRGLREHGGVSCFEFARLFENVS